MHYRIVIFMIGLFFGQQSFGQEEICSPEIKNALHNQLVEEFLKDSAEIPLAVVKKEEFEIIFSGNQLDYVKCGFWSKFDDHISTIEVRKYANDDKYHIYSDGKLEKRCSSKKVKIVKSDLNFLDKRERVADTFNDFSLLKELSDEDVYTLASIKGVGKCRYGYSGGISIKPALKKSRGLTKILNQNIKIASKQSGRSGISRSVLVGKSLKKMVKDGHCGEFSKIPRKKRLQDSLGILVTYDLGIEVLKSKSQFDDKKLMKLGYSAKAFRKGLGYDIDKLIELKFDVSSIYRAGVPKKKIKERFTAKDLKSGSMSSYYLKEIGYTSAEGKEAGYSLDDLKSNYSYKDLGKTFSASEFKEEGFSSYYLKEAGFSVSEAKTGGYDLDDLKSNYSYPKLAESFSPKEFKEEGFSSYYLKEAGFSVKEAKLAGYEIDDLKGNYSYKELGKVFTPKEFKEEGYSSYYIKEAGFDIHAAKAGGYDIDDLKGNYSYKKLGLAFTPKEFKEESYSSYYVKEAGFSAEEAKAGGYDIDDLKGNYGYKKLGEAFSAKEFRKEGYSAYYVKEAGFSAKEALEAGYTFSSLSNHYNDSELRSASGLNLAE